MDFVPGRPISAYPGGPVGLVKELGALFAKTQAAPSFHSLGNFPDLIRDLLAGLDNSPHLTPGKLEPRAEGLDLIRSALPWDPLSLVSSHNDPNPRNVLFDGERLWLIDWSLRSEMIRWWT
jgi:hypothetical protein